MDGADMMTKKRTLSWTAVLVTFAAVLCLAAVLIPVVSGENITLEDPLISLSYLNGIFKTELLSAVSDTIDAEVEALDDELTRKISGVRDAIGHVSSPSSTHSTISLPTGNSYTVGAETEFLLISGSAAAKEAGLLDVTTGLTVAQGEALLENHLYITVSPTSVVAESTAKLLVRN